MRDVMSMALKQLQLELPQGDVSDSRSAFFRCGRAPTPFSVPPSEEYLKELHACWRDPRALSWLSSDVRVLAAMHESVKAGLDRMSAVEPAVASLIVSPDEALRPEVRFPRTQSRVTDDLLCKAYNAGARAGRLGNSLALDQELSALLAKGAIEAVDPLLQPRGYYSTYFLVAKKTGGFHPILDLRGLNQYLKVLPFHMLTTAEILQTVVAGDWFKSGDLTDAYFHVPIAAEHRRFLRFAYQGRHWQFRMLPFGLSLSLRVFTRCVKAALSPLRASGVRILPYLDDWLLCAPTQVAASRDTSRLLLQVSRLGLKVNLAKSCLVPSQTTTFLGMHLDSTTMKARPSVHRVDDIGHSCRAHGLVVSRRGVVTMDASYKGWGAVWQHRAIWGLWGPRERTEHINVLELRVVHIALRLRPLPAPRVPDWDLPLVPPLEPLAQADLKWLSCKTAFLLAIVSAKRGSYPLSKQRLSHWIVSAICHAYAVGRRSLRVRNPCFCEKIL
ncbi:uncharacterized protein LOC118562836 [Fundulus heteroclitus]|uniref:uncharacterized protein LOC118562836 n=1 Tax=Fundulus heteroclitus TaxID=8078 RepID=UPI00165B5DEA|nr:uncharacterized protein LOC118562836 [Fundulus heteroclitus]